MENTDQGDGRRGEWWIGKPLLLVRWAFGSFYFSSWKKGSLGRGSFQEPLRRALFCVFLCSELIFSCKSHRNFFQKLPLQCRHFLEKPPREKTPKRSCWLLTKGTRAPNLSWALASTLVLRSGVCLMVPSYPSSQEKRRLRQKFPGVKPDERSGRRTRKGDSTSMNVDHQGMWEVALALQHRRWRQLTCMLCSETSRANGSECRLREQPQGLLDVWMSVW